MMDAQSWGWPRPGDGQVPDAPVVRLWPTPPGARHFGARSVSRMSMSPAALKVARRAEQLLREERRAKRKARMVHRSTHLVVALGGSVTAYCVVRILLGRLAHPPRSPT